MKLNAQFVSSFPTVASLPDDGKPEIALIGRSNVGKSSLINALVERKQLAKTSATPGKTQLLNYFLVNGEFYLVDMPGYGYAKTAMTKRLDWARVSEQYFTSRKQLRATGILIDARHPQLENDVMVVEWFSERNLPFFLVLTKIDKVKQQELARHEAMLRQEVHTAQTIIKTSSESGRGIVELKRHIYEIWRNSEAT